MIIDIPDKGMKVEFPDDMDMKEVERQIYTNVYDQDVISTAPEKSFLEKGKDVAKDVFQKAIDPWTVSEEEEAFRPDNPPDIDIMSRAAEVKPNQPPEKTILSYAPYMAVKAVKGAMGPLLSPLKTLGMDSEGVLNTAAEYWKKRLPDVGIPNAGIVFDENGDLDIERIDDMPLSEIVGATSEGAGFLGPASVSLRGAGLITEKLGAYARPFYRSILKGMIGGALLGEGKKDETLESMAMFGLFEGAGFAIGEIPGAIKGIKNSNAYRKATIKERGLVVQDLETTIKQNPGMSEAELVKTSDAYFAEALEKRRTGIETEVVHKMPDGTTMKGPIHEGAVPGTETKLPIVKPEAIKAEPVKDLRTGGMTPEIIKSIPDPVVRAFAEGRLSISEKQKATAQKVDDRIKELRDKGESPFFEKPKAEPKPESPEVKKETPEKIAENINEELPEHGIKYDGEFDRTALKKGPLYQFTPQSGPFKGRTIAVEELSVDAVKNRIADLEKEKPVTEPEKVEDIDPITKKYLDREKIKKAIKPLLEKEAAPVLIQKETWKGKELTRGVIIHPSTKQPGKFQLTWWDDRGFSGDTNYKTKDDAINAAMADGYHTIGKEEFKRISKTEEFKKGNQAAAEVQKWNQEQREKEKARQVDKKPEKVKVDKDLIQKIDAMQNEVKTTRTKGVTQARPNQEGETISFSADSPRWMQDLQSARKKDKKPALSRKDLNALFDKKRSGKPLTTRQQDQYNYLEKAINEYAGEAGEFIAEEKATELEKKGFEVYGGAEIPVADLNPGDTVIATIDGVKDTYVVKGINKEGERIFQDGMQREIHMFDDIKVEGLKKKPVKKKPIKESQVSMFGEPEKPKDLFGTDLKTDKKKKTKPVEEKPKGPVETQPGLDLGKDFQQEKSGQKKIFKSISDAAPQERVKREKPLITEAQKKATAKKKAVKETQLKIETAEDAKKAVHSMVRQRRFNLNLSSYETNKFINDIEQVTTRVQREVLPFVIEKTSVPKELNRPDLEKAHGENKELLADIAGQVKAHFDKGWKKYKESIGDMSVQEIENYVTHIWEIPRSKKQEVTNWFTTKNRFAKQRYIETLEKGIKELGLKPKVLDIGEIIRIHDAATNKAIENKKLVDDLVKLKKDGVPLIERMDKAPPDWVLINHPSLNKSVFIPGESKMGEKITPELENILYEMGVAIGRRINSKVWGKPSKVAGLYKTGDPPEVRFQRFMKNKTIAHEIGHHLDLTLGLGDTFLNKHRTELYALNKDRIEKSGLDPEYTNKTSEQIAEAFAFLFTDPKLMTRVAPTAMTDMLAMLKQDGVLSKLIGFDFEKKAKNLIEEQLNTLTKIPVKVHPDIVRPLRVVFESTDPSEIMQAYDSIAGILKKTSLSLSLFHHLALGETGVATTGPGKVAGIYFNPVKIYNALVKGQFDVFKKEAIAKDAIGHGLQMGATSDIPVQKIQGYLNDFAAKTKNVAIVNKATEFLRTFNEKWDTALWDYLHDTLKLYAYESLTVQYVDQTKPAKAQKEEIAQFVNDTFGGQNWDVLMITPKEVQIMTRALLSADWTISTMRQALAPTGIGTIHKGINKPLRRKMGRMFWLKAGLYFGVGINMLNVTFRKADRKENPEYYKNRGKDIIEDSMYGNALGHKSHLFVGRYEDGTERYIRWGKQFRELMEMFVDDSGFSPVSASVKKIGGKANPLLQLTAQITTGHSLSGFKNDDISGKKGWDFAAGIFKTLLLSPLPFSSRTLMTPNKEFHITDIAMPSSKGMSRYKVMSLFKIAIMKKDDQFLKEVYQDALENNLPAYTLFNASLTSLKAEETREYGKTLKDLKDLREHAPVKTPKEAMILQRKIKRLIKEKKDKMVGIKMLEVAITKAKIYNMEKGE